VQLKELLLGLLVEDKGIESIPLKLGEAEESADPDCGADC
jgi:hypothetical protein